MKTLWVIALLVAASAAQAIPIVECRDSQSQCPDGLILAANGITGYIGERDPIVPPDLNGVFARLWYAEYLLGDWWEVHAWEYDVPTQTLNLALAPEAFFDSLDQPVYGVKEPSTLVLLGAGLLGLGLLRRRNRDY